MIGKILLGMLTGFIALPLLAADERVGADITPVFARAAKGEPLRYVALGGSITYGGKGWIDEWLRAQFPKSAVTTVNSGISATGSELGVFRVERDVITHQPDLVAIEFCVNDWGIPDEDVYRYMETLIVRLKTLPKPPAIVILEAASNPKKTPVERHRKVAQHYGLLEVDLQAAMDAELAKEQKPWSNYFKDGVHPIEAGHAVYTREITAKLAPFVEKAKAGTIAQAAPLPSPLSKKPLMLDAHLVELANVVCPWKAEAVPGWPGLYFRGVISAKPGDKLDLTLRGSTFGIFYQQQTGYGKFDASVDALPPVTLDANVAHPYKHVLLAKDLPPGEHTIKITTPADPAQFKPVKLGYVLVSGVK